MKSVVHTLTNIKLKKLTLKSSFNSNVDFLWLKAWTFKDAVPSWVGYMQIGYDK